MKTLAIAVHPDDETLGCGGTLLRLLAAGDEVDWVVVTKAHEPRWSAETIARKASEVAAVAAAYPFARTFTLGLPTTQLDALGSSGLIEGLRDVFEESRPESILLPHPDDVHTDHRATFNAAVAVLRPPWMARAGIRRVACYETLSSTDAGAPTLGVFRPTVFVDVGAHIERKIDIMALYETEAQQDPLPRGPSAIRALARFRGATIGVEYAEAFELVRELA